MLPDLIEIVPLNSRVRAEITVPGSKSITNRALVLAALAEGETVLEGALWSEDTQVMVECLQELGWMVNVNPDPHEACNRSITVYGLGGHIPRGGTAEQPLELFVGNAGTAARFLSALVCLGEGVYRLHGVPRMHERPQAALFQALRQLGYRIEAPQDKLPALIHGAGARAGKCQVSIAESSQFASALLLCAKTGGWSVEVTGENAEESPYVEMTKQLCKTFQGGTVFSIEPDASSGSYFWAADWLLWIRGPNTDMGQIIVKHWPESGWQVDSKYPEYRTISGPISRKLDLGDSIMTHIVVAPLNRPPVPAQFNFDQPGVGRTIGSAPPMIFRDLGRLRVQETERVYALKTELEKCGALVIEQGDSLQVFSDRALHGAEIETYDDHRIAMCFAILGLKVPGIKIKNPSCVKKTFPNFFQKLAAAPPAGLGATILEGRTRRPLAAKELFAE
jgi:3-phosphoshikimate 1-carboxyvinyltransferase